MRLFLLACALTLIASSVTGCVSRDRLYGPTEQQRLYDSIRPMLDTMRGPEM
jgi:hypothetical protein